MIISPAINRFILSFCSTFSILVSIIEVLPKEKRQKEEKTNLIGQCTVDLFPMLTGKTTTSSENNHGINIFC